VIHLDVINRLIWGFQEPITTKDNTTNRRRSLSAACFVKNIILLWQLQCPCIVLEVPVFFI